MIKQKIRRIKRKIRNNPEATQIAIIYTIYAVIGTAAGVLTYKAVQAQQNAERQIMNELSEAASKGKSILPGPDGYWWIIDNQPTEA